MNPDARIASYLNHLAYIDDKKPPPKQVQYMNYTHSVAWSFAKGEKRKSIYIKIFFNIKFFNKLFLNYSETRKR